MAEIKYEAAVKRLEEIVKQLESGSCPLEDSIKLFEEGASLVKTCEKLLSEAEQKVKILVGGKEEDFGVSNG
ncbi:MAG: exodeoxyribonuclease VII small subunit [Clostridia bacterium]|nr:exodeoxyribonuclease VII small subunit [Clostridia bacterium]